MSPLYMPEFSDPIKDLAVDPGFGIPKEDILKGFKLGYKMDYSSGLVVDWKWIV